MSEKATVETVKIDTARSERVVESPDTVPLEYLDRYELRRPLSKGGFATVYEGYDPRIKRSVAIKRCSSLDEDNHDRFFREAEIAGNLSHPNIVRIFDFGVADGIPFIVQELLSGRDLADWIESGLDLSTHDRVRILLQIAQGLAYAHAHDVIHRDIKPANIRVLDDGSIKLLDFGVAAIQEAPSDLTAAGTTVGTAAYIAPEQIRGDRPARATDVFSFGVLAYELLSGHRPFDGETLSAVLYQIAHEQPQELRAGAIPRGLIRLVHSCLEKQAERRPESFEDIAEGLEEVLRDPRLRPPSAETVPIPTYPAGLPPTVPPMRTRTPPAPALRPKPTPGLAGMALQGPTVPLRDSSTRIQVARRPRRTGKALLSLVIVCGALPAYSFFGGPLPEPISRAIGAAESRLPGQLRAGLDIFRGPDPLPVPVGVPSTGPGAQVAEEQVADPAPAAEPTAPESDPVTAAIATLEAKRAPAQPATEPASRPRRSVSSTAPATIFLPPGWHPQMMVSVDGGAFQALDRRRTRQLPPGAHKIVFWLNTTSYQVLKSLAVKLEPAETRTIESPLAPPAALRAAVVPDTVTGRIEIDGRSLDLPLDAPHVLDPGIHRITLYPSPTDPLGPLTKSVDLRSATAHLVTFDMRRRRALLEVGEAFEWDG